MAPTRTRGHHLVVGFQPFTHASEPPRMLSASPLRLRAPAGLLGRRGMSKKRKLSDDQDVGSQMGVSVEDDKFLLSERVRDKNIILQSF